MIRNTILQTFGPNGPSSGERIGIVTLMDDVPLWGKVPGIQSRLKRREDFKSLGII